MARCKPPPCHSMSAKAGADVALTAGPQEAPIQTENAKRNNNHDKHERKMKIDNKKKGTGDMPNELVVVIVAMVAVVCTLGVGAGAGAAAGGGGGGRPEGGVAGHQEEAAAAPAAAWPTLLLVPSNVLEAELTKM